MTKRQVTRRDVPVASLETLSFVVCLKTKERYTVLGQIYAPAYFLAQDKVRDLLVASGVSEVDIVQKSPLFSDIHLGNKAVVHIIPLVPFENWVHVIPNFLETDTIDLSAQKTAGVKKSPSTSLGILFL